MNIPVVTAGSGVGNLVQDLERLHGPVTVVRRCAEMPELIAACQSGIARAAIITDDAGEITAALADRLASSGVALLVLSDEENVQRRLDTLDIVHAPRNSRPEVLSDLVAEAVGRLDDGAGRAALLADPSRALSDWTGESRTGQGRGGTTDGTADCGTGRDRKSVV